MRRLGMFLGFIALAAPTTASAQAPDAGVSMDAAVEQQADGGEAPEVIEEPAPDGGVVESPPVDDPTTAVGPDEPVTSEPLAEDPTGYDVSEGTTARPGEERSLAEDAPVEPEDIVLLVPRIVLFVPKLVLTAVFWPIRELMRITERHAIIEHIEEILYWNDEKTLGLVPALALQSRFGFTAGFDLFHNNLLGYDESLTAKARFFGRYNQAYELSLEADRFAGTRLWIESRARFEENPDTFFAGLGVTDQVGTGPGLDPRSATAETYFREQRFLGLLRAGVTLGRRGGQIQLGGTAVFNHRNFEDNDSGDAQTSAVFDTSALAGFDDGATTLEVNGNIVIDTRERHGLDSRGVHLDLFGGYAIPVGDHSFVHYGAELAWTIDLFHRTRLLVLRAGLEAVHAEDEEIPFTDLPRLGGADRLRGYGEARFRDRIAAFGTVEYRYPIHRNLMGYGFLDAGHAARSYGALFDTIRFGGGGGLLLGTADSISLRIDLSYGEDFNVFVSTDLASAFEGRGEQL